MDDCHATAHEIHHQEYGPKGTWRKLIVPAHKLIHLCVAHHRAAHPPRQPSPPRSETP